MSHVSSSHRPTLSAQTMLSLQRGMNLRSIPLRLRRSTGLLLAVLLLGLVGVLLHGMTPSTGQGLSTTAAEDGLISSMFGYPSESNPVSVPILSGEPQRDANDLIFVENIGQFEAGVLFAVQAESGVLFIGQDALWMTVVESPQALRDHPGDFPAGFEPDRTLQGTNLRITFPDASPTARVVPFDSHKASISYFKGSDPTDWVVEAPAWRGIRYESLYPGLDLVITSEEGAWTWSLVPQEQQGLRLTPFTMQAEVEEPHIQLRIEGAEALTLDNAAVRAETVLGDLEVPLIDAEAATGNALVPEGTKPSLERDEVVDPFQSPSPVDPISSSLEGYSKRASLISIPLAFYTGSLQLAPLAEARPDDLFFSTYLGSLGGGNWANAIDVDSEGSAYIAGLVFSANLPTTPGAFQTTAGEGFDGFVAKFNADASALVYASYIAGSLEDEVRGIAVGEDGSAVLVGRTTSLDFPVTTGAFDTTIDFGDAFVLKLNPSGTDLIFSTFLGGSAGEEAMDVALDASGAPYVTGQTTSTDFPVTPGAAQTTHGGGGFDGFVSKLTPDGSNLVYSTYLGGSSTDCEVGGIEQECAIAVDVFGSAYIGGPTHSQDFPVTPGGFDTEANGGRDAFIVKLSPAGDIFNFATYVGGSGDECQRDCDIAVDNYGASYLAGSTTSIDFPTTPGVWDQNPNGGLDAFAVKLSPDGSRLLYGTYIGGSDFDNVFTASVTRAGELFIGGETRSDDAPITVTGEQVCASCPLKSDIFLALLGVDGSLSYATYIGGSDDDVAHAMALDGVDHVYLTGRTNSHDYPTTPGAYQITRIGNDNSFLARLDVPTVDPPLIDLALSTVEVVPDIFPASDFIGAAVVVTLVDTLGDPVVGHPVEIIPAGSQITVNPPIATTNVSGVAQAEIRSTVAQEVIVSARDAVSNASLFDVATLTFVAGPTDPDLSTLTAEPSVVAADGVTPTVVAITLLDAHGNPVVGHEIIVLHNGFGNIVLQSESFESDAEGRVIVEARSNYPRIVTFNARDAIDGVMLNASAQVEFISTDLDHSTITSDRSIVTANGVDYATITITFLDRLDQPVNGHGVVLRLDDPEGINVDMPDPVTDENGQVIARVRASAPRQVTFGAGDLVIESDINAMYAGAFFYLRVLAVKTILA